VKKIIALFMTLALVISVLAVPALAEENGSSADLVTSATASNGQNNLTGHGRNNRNVQNGQMPQMPGQNDRNGQVQQFPGQNDQNSQMPQIPGQNNQNGQNGQTPGRNGQMPGKGGRNGRQGKGVAGVSGMQSVFDQLLADGVITQEVYDAIIAWISQHMPQAPQNTAVSAEGTEAAEGTEPPALPDAPQDNQADAQEQLLKELLDSGVITQEQYDLLISGLRIATAVPSGT